MTHCTHNEFAQPLENANQRFRFLKQFDELDFAKKAGCRDRLRASDTRWFPGDLLSAVFARALCEHRAIPFKEVLESFEFYACVRNQIRAPNLADLCCGHGLVGILFAMFERQVERVSLIDKVRPASFDTALAAATEVAPWVTEKIRYLECDLENANEHLPKGTSVVGVHACGERTDQCIEHAIKSRGSVAVLPCCRHHAPHPSPPSIKQAIGGDLAIDVDRTYRLHNAGYRVKWDAIPPTITPMNRVLIGKQR